MMKMGPLPATHPLVVDCTLCPACYRGFVAGEFVTLIPLGPGPDPEAQERAREGQAYSAIAVPVHWVCATGEE